ncbi:MAG: Glycogen synthase, ADP-glucose transglucosylase, partial [uncultured Solirubrobacteraceae bacterium]
ARGAADARVPAGGLRRRRRPRRVPRPRAGRAGRPGGALLGRRAQRSRGARLRRLGRAGGQGAASRGPAGGVGRPPHGGGRRGSRARPQPHLVRAVRRPPGEADLRHPARRDGPLARADAPVEGRAARWRLRALELLREDRAGGRRRAGRRLAGLQGRHPRLLPGDRRVARRGHLQRHRHGRVHAGPGYRRPRAPRHRSVAPDGGLRRAHHPPEGRRPPDPGGGGLRSGRSARAVRRRARHARDRRRGGGRRRATQGVARRRLLDPRDAPQAGRHPAALARDRLRVPVDLRAARHRQPRGHGLRGGGRRHRHRRDRRSGRRRRDGAAGALRERPRIHRSRRSRGLRRRDRRARQRPDRRPGDGGAHGQGRPRSRHGALRVAGHRRADARALRARLGARRL